MSIKERLLRSLGRRSAPAERANTAATRVDPPEQGRAPANVRRWMAIVALAALLTPRLLSPPPLSMDNHSLLSLDIALSRALCDRVALAPSGLFTPTRFVAAHPEARYTPIRQIVQAQAGSIPAYCETLTQPIVNNENSLMLLMWLYALADGEASVARIGVFLHCLRLICVAAFAFVLVRAGARLVFAALTLAAALGILLALDFMRYDLWYFRSCRYSLYPFMLAEPLLCIASYGLAFSSSIPTRTVRLALFCFWCGLLSAFCANTRTSYSPIYLAFFGAFLFAVSPRWTEPRTLARRLALATLAFACGMVLFTQAVIRPLRPPEARTLGNYQYHAVAHNLVLGLAVPENELSRREGIRWDDTVGIDLARRKDPSATFLGPTYERALFAYYRDLWLNEPHAMARIYWGKLLLAGTQLLRSGPGSRTSRLLFSAALWPLSLLPNGLLLLGVLGGTGIFALLVARRRSAPLPFALALVMAAGTAVLVESAIIMPQFHLPYHSLLLFSCAVLGLLAWQGAFLGVTRLTRPVGHRLTALLRAPGASRGFRAILGAALALLAIEGVARWSGGHTLAQAEVDAPQPSLEDAQRAIAPLPSAAGVDPAWFAQTPAVAPRRPVDPDLDVTSRYFAGFRARRADVFKLWNAKYLDEQICTRDDFGFFRDFPRFVFVFTPTDGRDRPRFRHPANRVTPDGVAWNAFGWRGEMLPRPKPTRVIRLAFLGSTATVETSNPVRAFPDYIEHWLNLWAKRQGLALTFEVLNAARDGADSTDLAASFRQDVLGFAPDLVIYHEGATRFDLGDMLDPASGHGQPSSWERWPRPSRYSALAWRLWAWRQRTLGAGPERRYRRRLPLRWPSGVDERDPDLDSPSLPLHLETILHDLDEIRRQAQTGGTTLAVTSFPWMVWDAMTFDPLRQARPQAYVAYLNERLPRCRYADVARMADFQNRVLAKFARRHGLSFIDVAGALPRDTRFFMNPVESYPEGARMRAWVMLQGLIPLIQERLASGAWPRAASSGPDALAVAAAPVPPPYELERIELSAARRACPQPSHE